MTTLAWIGWTEFVVIAVIAVLIFGRRLPEVGRSLGQGLVEFKKGLRDVKHDVKEAVDETKEVAAQADQAGEEDEKKG
jgi:sec-independent protein translocase protein TatA